MQAAVEGLAPGEDQLDPNRVVPGVRGPGLIDRLRSSLSRNGTEFMTFTAEKPSR